jgi:FKBP-type peptidyl-prolyl cis-trans isomerases 2
MMDTNGNRLNGSVVEVKEDVIKMDFNHPLAGETLNFSGKVLTVRESTPEEIAALFAPQGGGCGCGSGCGCGDGEEDFLRMRQRKRNSWRMRFRMRMSLKVIDIR